MGGNKGVIFCIKTCFRSVCRHPFLLGMVFAMIFLYKYFPLMFSLLVWASPVFLSTAALLGTLLSYGQPNNHVIHKEDRLSNDNVFFRNGVQRYGNLVEKDGSFDNVERFLEIRRDVVERSIDEANSTATNFSDVYRDDMLSRNNAVLDKEKSREFQTDKQGSVERKLPDILFEQNDKLTDLKKGNSESLGIQELHGKSLDQPQNKTSEKVDGNSPTGSHWKQEDGEEDDDRDVSDSGSDKTASDRTDSVTSGRTSMTDGNPIVDELHPLLDEDAPQPTHMSPEVSDATSEISSNSISESSYDLDTDMETHGEELEVTDVEEEIYADHDDDVKSAISWTDDDHKNVINLGCSDLERNQRLENLIATRSLRKSMKIMAERNLIDLDGIDRPLNVAHISTARRNPFDLSLNVAQISTARRNPFDLSHDLNFNFPGSAPSRMALRRSPFELPYDPGEEKHDLMGDEYEHVVTLQPKDPPFLRRNETFSAGPSSLGTSRHDYNFRPSYTLQRKSSEFSESKASSDPETKASSDPETESLGSVEELEDKIPVEEDDSREPVVTTIAEHPSEDVGHGSESSEDENTFESAEAEKKDATPHDIKVNLGDVDNSQAKVSSLSETAVADTHMEGDTGEAIEVVTPDDSSSTSLTEEHENVFIEKEGEQLLHFKPTLESSDAESTSQLVDDTHHKEPVYDSSPTRLSSSSIFSDHQVEIVETNFPPVSVKHTISATDNESNVSNQITEKNTPATETDENLVSAYHQSPSDRNTSIQSDKELPMSDQSVVERSPVKHKELHDSPKCVNGSEVQEVVKESQQNSKPTTSEAASTQSEILKTEATPDQPDSEDNIPRGENSDTILSSEKPLLEKTGSGPADSEEVPSQNAGETISDMPVESGTVKDKEPRSKEDEHKDDGSGESEISPKEDKIPHVRNSDAILFSEKTGPGPSDSEEDPVQNARETISDMPVESGTVKDKEPCYKEDEYKHDGSGDLEISPQEDNLPHVRNSDTMLISEKPLEKTASGPVDSEEVPSRNAAETISDMPVELGTVKDKEPCYKEDEHADSISGESEISPQGRSGLEAEVGMAVAEAQSLEDVKLAPKQVDGEEIKKPPDLSPNETKDGDSEHGLLHRSSVPNENRLELSRSVQDDHSEQHHEEASNKKDIPESNIDDPKQSPHPKSWWKRFRSS